MKFGGNVAANTEGQGMKSQIKQQLDSEQKLSGDDYMTALFNMIFLMQTRISKQIVGEEMHDELFRKYFIRLYRNIRQMENKFKELFEPEESDSFVRYSNSMNDLASVFKVKKVEKQVVIDSARGEVQQSKKAFKKNQEDLSKIIFGVG